jgi:hypothetical protein
MASIRQILNEDQAKPALLNKPNGKKKISEQEFQEYYQINMKCSQRLLLVNSLEKTSTMEIEDTNKSCGN